MKNFISKYLWAAKALSAKDWSAPSVIVLARHMAHDGASTTEIRDAIWPSVHVNTARNRLKKFNIVPLDQTDRAHRGKETGLSNHDGGVNYKPYRPREVAR